MKIIIDNKIPYIRGVLEPYAEVLYLPGAETTAEVVKDADALITRTRTLCSREVLEGSKVRLIASATIGFDHIDTEYCSEAGIEWANAPGCNAQSVNQYLASALFSYARRRGVELKGQTIGVVGVGQVGSRVARTCEILGMNVLGNDPPRQRAEGASQFVSLETIRQQADIISFHVPLNRGGRDNTLHMVDEEFLSGLDKSPLLINTCRGEVFDSPAVVRARRQNRVCGLVIDCWEHEPDIDLDLLDMTDFGTPHIAGYSRDGKANGTMVSVRLVSRFFKLGIDDWRPVGVEPAPRPLIGLAGDGQTEQSLLAGAVCATYDIENDDAALRKAPRLFEQLRGDYPVRREFDSHTVKPLNINPGVTRKLKALGFTVLQDALRPGK